MFNETTVVLKVEGTAKAQSHPSRTDRWNEEFEITVDKANEVEIAIYDKQLGEQSTPIGLLWIRLSDIVEALRRQRVGNDTVQGGWVTAAGAMRSPDGIPHDGSIPNDLNSPLPVATSTSYNGAGQEAQPEGVFAWFSVEPVGALALHVDFGELICLVLQQ